MMVRDGRTLTMRLDPAEEIGDRHWTVSYRYVMESGPAFVDLAGEVGAPLFARIFDLKCRGEAAGRQQLCHIRTTTSWIALTKPVI
jgi:hypothetical protein